MNVGAISGAQGGVSPAGAKQKDSVLTSIQKQITDLQKEVKNLGKNSTLSPEEKTEKQKVLREQIADLQRQYSDRQLQLQEEATERKRAQRGEDPARTQESQDPDAARMQAVIESTTQLQHAQKYDEVIISAEGRLRTLDRQLATDGGDALASSRIERDQVAATLVDLRDSRADALEETNETVTENAEHIAESEKAETEKAEAKKGNKTEAEAEGQKEQISETSKTPENAESAKSTENAESTEEPAR